MSSLRLIQGRSRAFPASPRPRPASPGLATVRGSLPAPARERDALRFENPVRTGDALRFRLGADGPVRLELVSLSGREGWVVIDGSLRPGWHSITLPPGIPPGTYFVRLSTRSGRESAMMVVAR